MESVPHAPYSLRLARVGARLQLLPKQCLVAQILNMHELQKIALETGHQQVVDIIRMTDDALRLAGNNLEDSLLKLSKQQLVELLAYAHTQMICQNNYPPFRRSVMTRIEDALGPSNRHTEGRLLMLPKEQLSELLSSAYHAEFKRCADVGNYIRATIVCDLEAALVPVNGTMDVQEDILQHMVRVIIDSFHTYAHSRRRASSQNLGLPVYRYPPPRLRIDEYDAVWGRCGFFDSDRYGPIYLEAVTTLKTIVSLASCCKTLHSALNNRLQACRKISDLSTTFRPVDMLIYGHLQVHRLLQDAALTHRERRARHRSGVIHTRQYDVYERNKVIRVFQLLGSAWRRGAMPQLKSLSFKGCDLHKSRARALATFCLNVGLPPQLQELNFSWNRICDGGIKTISAALAESAAAKSIKKLSFRENLVGDDGLAAMLAQASRLPCLTALNFQCNRIGEQGACELAASLAKGQVNTLRSLGLAYNRIHFTDAGRSVLTRLIAAGLTLDMVPDEHDGFCN